VKKEDKWEVVYTDTFGGRANFAWVKRASFTLPADATNRSVRMRAKKELGLTGVRFRNDYVCPESMILHEVGAPRVLFIDLVEEVEGSPEESAFSRYAKARGIHEPLHTRTLDEVREYSLKLKRDSRGTTEAEIN